MKAFEPVAPNGSAQFPRKQLSLGVDQWNHYYVRAINGEVRLWVNGEEVSGGSNCQPATATCASNPKARPLNSRTSASATAVAL